MLREPWRRLPNRLRVRATEAGRVSRRRYRAQSIAALVEENPEAGMFVEVLTSMTDYGACLAGIPCAAAASPHSASLTQDAP